jgi:hypothetical protein
MAADPDADQRAASAREAARQYAADQAALLREPRSRAREGPRPPAVAALVDLAERSVRQGWRGCEHLTARQPVYWRPEAPHTLLCRACDPGPLLLASKRCALCGQLGSGPDDLTVVRALAGEVTITASLCERCHPTGGL